MASNSTWGVLSGAAILDPSAGEQTEVAGSREYQRDLLRMFSEKFTMDTSSGTGFHTHLDLVDRLLAEPRSPDTRPDLVILTNALPDVHPFDTTSAYLNWKLGGTATSFAITEQGLLAPFSALRIAAAYQRVSRYYTAVIVILEQTTLPNHDPLVVDNNLVDSAALLVFGGQADLATSPARTERHLAVDTVHIGAATEQCASLAASAMSTATLLVNGPWQQHERAVPDGTDVLRTPAGTYCTSVWLALAEHYAEWMQRYETVILHDTDPRSNRCGSVVLRSTLDGSPTG